MSGQGHLDSRWHKLLMKAYGAAGQPTVREVAAVSGLSRTTTHNIITGMVVPGRDRLASFVKALGVTIDQYAEIMSAFDDRPLNFERTHSRSATDNVAIRRGLADLNDSMRSVQDQLVDLNDSMRSVLEALADVGAAIRELKQ